MSSQRRNPRPTKKQLAEKQALMSQRSRSIKASLLKILSMDMARLYNQDPQTNSIDREARSIQKPNLTDKTLDAPDEQENFSDPKRLQESEQRLGTKARDLQEPHNSESSENSTQSTSAALVPLSQLVSFLTGLLIHYVISLFPHELVVSGIAIALIGMTILIIVVLAPWNRKLLWNLGSLFGGLLFAVLLL